MNEVGVEIIQTEETKEDGIKYLNINVSDSEVERNPDIVRLCADAGILEYVKSKTGHWIKEPMDLVRCSKCGHKGVRRLANNYCPNCGAKMEEELQWFDIA